jgi:asparagine synthase (glutamine-hydrolysing)
VIHLDQDFFDNFATFAERTVWLTDGSLDISRSHELYYSQLARAIAPVRITGNYGSEVLRGHSTFRGRMPTHGLFTSELMPFCRAAFGAFAEIRSDNDVSFAAMKEVPLHLHGMNAVAQSQLVVRSPYTDNELVALVYQTHTDARKTLDFSLRLIADLKPSLAELETDMGRGGHASLIRAHGRRLHRYATFKAEWYYNFGMPAWLSYFDDVLLRTLEPLFLGTHKIDNFRICVRDRLSNYVKSMLSDPGLATRQYLTAGSCQRLLTTKSISGRYVNDVSTLITLELIHRLLLSPTRLIRTSMASDVLAGRWSE